MRILIAGLGGIGQRHLRNLRALPGEKLEIIAVDPRQEIPVVNDQLQVEAGETMHSMYNVRIVPSLESALEWKPDVVFVCNPTSMHITTAVRAARAGCHLFIEKPLSHTMEQVDELIEMVKNRELVAVVGYQMRFHPCLQRLHELIRQGTVGRILSVHAEVGEYLPGWHKYEDYRQMYASRQDLGGGVILSQIHEMDYLYWLFGLPRSMYTLGGHLSSLEVDVEDTADILMKVDMDGQAFPVSLHEDYLQRPPSRTCKVIGDKGKILIDLVEPGVEVFDGEGRQISTEKFPNFQRNQLFMTECDHFLVTIQKNKSASGIGSLVSLQDARCSLRMALAAKESLTTGSVVELAR
jgi:predicted dehydrogenase